MTLVSVVIPAHNRCGPIQHAIQSVLVQSYSDLELIVVDDGSNDDTARIVEGYIRKDSRIRLISHGYRKGAQAARNAGIKAANGEWIAFLDSDDQWLPDSLNSRLRLAMTRGFHVVHSDCYRLGSDDTGLRQMRIPPLEGQVYRTLLRRFGPVFPGLLVSKDVLIRIGYLDEHIISWQEWDTAIRLAKDYEFGFIPEPTFIYDCRDRETISKNLLRTAQGYEQVVSKHLFSILRYVGPVTLAAHYQRAGCFYRDANDKGDAYRCFLTAFLLWPFTSSAIVKRAQRFFRWKAAC